MDYFAGLDVSVSPLGGLFSELNEKGNDLGLTQQIGQLGKMMQETQKRSATVGEDPSIPLCFNALARLNRCGRRSRSYDSCMAAQSPNPSMRFVSAQFWAQTGRRRESCQLKTSRQATQQLRRHFVAA